ncbi:hypothetical protein [Allobranchiibius sp. CTAmp26]|uniref:hypothetical protein n=1 Tax=Allobranchiibius sp. CTAmp26 TaxID=2815214 RepID=UPI001AA1B714|nr:hypothetical protein [Allobranchiibius sp. CTAmp26]MBO1756202.1 hypothetical protein [Allobranchiibius sp. CTAmp26]
MSVMVPPEPLFAGLFDDASALVGATLQETLEGRARRVGTPDATYVGSLLLPPRMVRPALSTKGALRITIVAGLADDIDQFVDTAELVSAHRRHELVGLHVPYSPKWREALNLLVPVVVRLPAGGAGLDALDEFSGSGPMIRAGIRSGGEHAAGSAELAAFVRGCATRSVAFHLAGGLGGAITGETDRHGPGMLNMLLATKLALRERSVQDLTAVLQQDDRDLVLTHIRGITEDKALEIRRVFRSVSYADVHTAVQDLNSLALTESASS